MAITTGTVNAPPSGTNPILVAENVTVAGNSGEVQFISLVDPDSASQRVASITTNGLKVDGSAVTQPVSMAAALPAGSNAIGSVSVSNLPAASGPGANSSGTGQFVAVADSYAVISVSSNGVTQLVAGVTGKSIRITGFFLMGNSTGTAQLVHGASNTALFGPLPLTAQTGVDVGGGYGQIYTLPAGDNLSISIASGGSAYGSVSYTVY